MTGSGTPAGKPVGKTFDNAGFAALLALTTVSSAMGVDGTLPLMPAIGRAFGADREAVQLTLTMFMLGIAVGQLVHGPLSDRFGRKSAIIGGLLLNTVATAGCAMAVSIEVLAALRFVHGVAASSGWLIARAAIRDRHQRDDAARVMSLMLIFHSAGPLLSPIVGAFLTVHYGWEAMFVFLSVYSLAVTVFFALTFRETIAETVADALKPGPMLRNFAEIARSPVFWAYTACATAAYGILFAFLSSSSDVIINYFGESEIDYGFMFSGAMVGLVCGMVASARLVSRFGGDNLLRWGMAVATVCGLLMVALAAFAIDHWFAVIAPMFFCMTSFAFIFPQSMAGVLQPFPHIAGATSSLVGFVQQIIGALTGVVLATLSDGSQLALTGGVLFWAAFGLAAYWLAVRKYRME